MAKGRRLTTSRSERYLGSNYAHAYSNAASTEISEFREEDVWSVVDSHTASSAAVDHDDEDPFGLQPRYYANGDWGSRTASGCGGTTVRNSCFPKMDRPAGGLSHAFQDSARTTMTSSRIVHQLRAQGGGGGGGEGGGDAINTSSNSNNAGRHPRQHHMAASVPVNVPDWKKILRVDSAGSLNDSDGGEFDYSGDSTVYPPHEYLARSRNTATMSVFEGVGRTLKGRDMSRLRDAVWSQTGFDG